MSLYPTVRLPSRRQFGLAYVAGVGLALTVGLVGYAVLAFESTLLLVVTLGIGLSLVGSVAYLAYLFRSVTVSEELVWQVAQWTSLGIALSTLLALVVGFGRVYVSDATVVAGLLVATITVGGLLGALLGVISGLRCQHDRLEELTQRNTVLNRVLRHNIKNDMNVILGHTTLLRQSVDDAGDHSVDAIERAAKKVTRLSGTARQIDRLTNGDDDGPVDAIETVTDCVDSVDGMYPDAEFTTDVPDRAWVDASCLLRPAVANVVENAVEHNDGAPTVHVSVRTDGDRVAISVADDGPGIYDRERTVLDADQEGPIRHGSGLGLWLVKWFVDHYDGDLTFEANAPSGTVVTVRLPAADPPAQPSSIEG